MDLLIATATEDRGSNVLRYDADLDGIADVTGQSVRRVAPLGSLP